MIGRKKGTKYKLFKGKGVWDYYFVPLPPTGNSKQNDTKLENTRKNKMNRPKSKAQPCQSMYE